MVVVFVVVDLVVSCAALRAENAMSIVAISINANIFFISKPLFISSNRIFCSF